MKKIVFIVICCFIPFLVHANERNKELTLAIAEWPTSFNPLVKSGVATYSISSQIFAGLTTLSTNGVEPYLAKKWEVSKDYKTYTFYLQENAYFHNGKAITSDDVVFSIQQSEKYHPFSPFLNNIDHIEILDKFTISIQLKVADEDFPSYFIPTLVPIIPKSVYQQKSIQHYNYNLVGSGPYQVKKIEKYHSIELEKFPKFFMSNSINFSKITYQSFYDSYEMFFALEHNYIDGFIFNATDSFYHSIDRSQLKDYKVEAYENIYPYIAIIFNMKKQLLAEKNVRKALTISLDKKRLAESFNSSTIQTVNAPLPPTHNFAYKPKNIYNIKEANALLDSLGIRKDNRGKRFSLKIDYLSYSYINEIVNWLQYNWANALGVDLILQENKLENMQDRNHLSEDYDLYLDEFFIWHLPHLGMHRFYYSIPEQKNNLSFYNNETVNALFQQLAEAETYAVKKEIFYQIQNVLAKDYVALWLISDQPFLIYSNKIQGLEKIPYKTMLPLLNVGKNE